MSYGTRHYGKAGKRQNPGKWLCATCQTQTTKEGCRRQDCDPKYFPSNLEFARAGQLLMRQSLGQIKGLKFHPRFDLTVNGRKIATLVLDSQYVDADGKVHLEDVKRKNWREMDPVAALKIDLFGALFPNQPITTVIMKG